jgi:hypothetical protein
MKSLFILASVLVVLFLVAPNKVEAQNCKPDYSGQDTISKQQVEQWNQSVFSTGFASSLMSTSQVSIFVMFGSNGTSNYVAVQIQKQEESKQNATFESALRAAKGNQFYFGIKNAEPTMFTATEVSNSSKAGGLITGKIITTVVLSATVSNNELAALRESLTHKQIDAVRVVLAGDLRIEKAVNDKTGKKMMEKFGCFYQSLDKKGNDLSAVGLQPVPPSDASIPGKYIRKDKTSDYIELKPEGTFSIQYEGKDYVGNYAIQADNIIVQVLNRQAMTGRFSGNTMTFPDGNVYEKQAETQKTIAASQLTIDQIIAMVAAKLPIIITTIQKSSTKFDLTPETLIKLKTAGVSDAVIRAMPR